MSSDAPASSPDPAPVTAILGTTGVAGGGPDRGSTGVAGGGPDLGTTGVAGGGPDRGSTGVAGGDVVRGLPEDRPSDGLQGTVEAIVGFAIDGAGRVLRPEAAASVATTFGFPLALALLVLLFLLVQSRMDDRDPKLRSAPRSVADSLVAFEDDAR